MAMSTATIDYADLPAATMDAMYATWTGDPSDAPWTNFVQLDIGVFLAITICLTFLVTMAVILRMYTRRTIVRKLAFDDWTLVAAYISYLVFFGWNLGVVINIQVNTMEKTWWSSFAKFYYFQCTFVPCAILIRAAIAAFFLRALPVVNYQIQRGLIIGLFWLYVAFMITTMFIGIFQCGVPSTDFQTWDVGTCLDPKVIRGISLTSSVFTTALDWAMAAVPVVLVCRSAISFQAKMTSICILVFAVCGSVLAVLSVYKSSTSLIEFPSDTPNYMTIVKYRLSENGMGIIAVSLAATRPLMEKMADNVKSSRIGSWTGSRIGSWGGGSTRQKSADYDVEATQFSKFKDPDAPTYIITIEPIQPGEC